MSRWDEPIFARFLSKVPSSRLIYLVSPFDPREEEQKITRYAYQAISVDGIELK
jgi:hypothetical protein